MSHVTNSFIVTLHPGIVQTHLSLFKGGGGDFDYLPQRGDLKIKKRGWKYGAGAGPLKRGRLTLFLFNFFKVYYVYIYKLLYPLQNCVMHLKKNYFFCNHNFMKKGHSKLSKNDPENISRFKITYL